MVSASYYSELYWKIITAVIVVCYCRVQLQTWELCSLLLLQMQVWWVKYKWIVWCTNVFVIYYSMFLSVLTLHTTQQHLHLAGLEQSGLMFNANQSDDFQLLFAICLSFTMYLPQIRFSGFNLHVLPSFWISDDLFCWFVSF